MITVDRRSILIRFAAARTGIIALIAVSVLVGSAVPSAAIVSEKDILGDLPVGSVSEETTRIAPDVGMEAGILVASNGRVLWAREPDQERAMASTTKIMTAVVAFEQGTLDELVTVSSRAAGIGESAARLRAGESYPLSTLLEAILVRSGNDASIAIAEHIAGSVEKFAELMNAKAVELGLEHTHFANPHGLDAEDHYTSAADLATLARYAMGKPEFRRMVGLESTVVPNTDGPGELENSNLLITTLEGATGVKTGWTGRAGYCLVASAEREGMELFAVVLGTDDEMQRFQQAGLLLEWGFFHYTEQRLAESGESVESIEVADYLDASLEVVVEKPVAVRVFEPAGPVQRVISLPETIEAPVTARERIGTLSFIQGERLVAQVALVAAEEVRRPSLPERLWISIVRAWRSVFGEPVPVPVM